MISLALVFAAVAALAAGSGYIDGREYVYRYYGQAYTGFPRIKHQYSGYAFQGKVYVQPRGGYALFRVGDMKKASFNQEIRDISEYDLPYEAIPGMEQVLGKPFKVYRENGIITKFELPSVEPSFSVNLKRGLISLFNLNFDQFEVEPTTEDNEIPRPDPDTHWYSVYEETPVGDCQTNYLIEHHPYYKTPDNNIVLNVTKVKNYHNCKKAPSKAYSTFYGNECGDSEYDKSHVFHGNAYTYYDIRGNRHHYIIERIRSEGVGEYTPYPMEGQYVSTYVNRTLELVEEREISQPMEFGSEVVTYDSLIYDFDYKKGYSEQVDLKEPHYVYDVFGKNVPLAEVRRQFDTLVQVYDDKTYREKIRDRNYPALFVELLRSVGTLSYDEIEELYKSYAEIPKDASDEQKRQRGLFVDVIVNLGTNPSILFGKYLIENRLARPQEALYFLQQLPYHVKEISEPLLDAVQELCDNQLVRKHKVLRAACVFSLSTMVYDRCVRRYQPEDLPEDEKYACPQDAALKYLSYIARNLESTEDEALKITYIKSLGTLGIVEAFPYLRPYIQGDYDMPSIYRDTAIYSLFRLSYRYPMKVRELLVPVLGNYSENYQVRLAAFKVLLLMKPEHYSYEAAAHQIKRDPDDQVKSFVYKTLKQYANSTHKCDRLRSEAARYALRLLDEVKEEFEKYDYSYSSQYYSAGYDEDYDYGGYTRFAYTASDTGYFPRNVYFGVEDFLGGKSYNTLGLGLRQYGLEKFFDKIFGPEGTFGRRSIFDLFKKRQKRDVSGVEKELSEIKQKMNLPVFEYGPIQGEFFFNYLGNPMASYYFDDKTFEGFFKEGRFSIPNIPAYYRQIPEYYYQRFMLPVDKMYVIPNEVGLPLLFDYKMPVYYYHYNKESSFRVEPGFFPEDRGGQFPDSVTYKHDGYFALERNLIASVGIIFPVDRAVFGAGVTRRGTISLPLKIAAQLIPKEHKFKFSFTPVAPHEIYRFKYEPYTFIDSYVNSVPQIMEQAYLPVRRLSRQQHERNYFYEALGVGFDVRTDYDNQFHDVGSLMEFIFKKDFREKFYYMVSNPRFEPYEVGVTFDYADQGATKQVETEFRYNFYDEPYTSEYLKEQRFEEYERQREDYRGPYYTNVLQVDVTATGDKERQIKSEFSWTRDLTRVYHKVNAYYERTPFLSSETQNFKICASSYLKYPYIDLKKLVTFDTQDLVRTVESELKVNFGKDCTSDQRIKVQGRVEPSEEQQEYERRREEPVTPERYNQYAYYYQECQREKERGIYFGENCMRYFELVTTLHKYIYDAKYENLSPTFLNYTYKFGDFFRYSRYFYADYNALDVQNPEGEIHIEANASVNLPVADIRVTKPHSRTYYTNLYLPNYKGFKSYPPYEEIHTVNSMSDLYCSVEGDHVYTFDRYEYTIPDINCYKIVAKDCSPQEYFTVLSTKISHPKYKQAIRVFVGGHKVEVLPVSEDSDLIIRVDGKRVAVSENEPYLHPDPESKIPLFYVTLRQIYYALHSEKYGLIVEYDGRGVFVRVAPYYRAKVCGLCGNYNGQKYDGYTNIHGCILEDESAYAYSYAIPSEDCALPQLKAKCPTKDGFGCSRLRTHVLQLNSGKVPQTCFSTEPVIECAPSCTSRGMVERKLGFHCLPSKDDSTKALLRLQQERVLYEVRRKSRDHESTVEVPEACYRE